MSRPGDTIVIPQRSTRADGVDPDIAKGSGGERAIFSHPGLVTDISSGRYVSASNVRTVKAIAVVAAYEEIDSCDAGRSILFFKNDTQFGFMWISGLISQQVFDTPVDLIAEVDTLWLMVGGGDGATVENLTVFVSFTATPPL